MASLLHRLSTAKLPQALRAVLLLAVYFIVLIGSLFLAYQLRFEFALPVDRSTQFIQALAWLIPLALAALWLAGQFRSLLSYFSLPDVLLIVKAQVAVCAVALVVWYTSAGLRAPPRSILLINLLSGTTGLIILRLSLRLIRERYYQRADIGRKQVNRVAIIGATDTGAYLIKQMKERPELRMQPVAIFDEDPKRWGQQIHGIPILGSYRLLLAPNNDLDLTEVVIAHGDIDNSGLRKIVHQLAAIGLKCQVAPSHELFGSNGNHQLQIRPVVIEDLLGRERVELQTDKISDLIKGRCVVVSGAGGSIGSELCQHILEYEPGRLILIERCEVQLFAAEQNLLRAKTPGILVPYVADITDKSRILAILREHRPEIIFHAAAHKHVPMMEHQPGEAFQNNVIGTMRLADAAIESGCERFVLISSDKAINPTSVMGATKRLAEMYLQALHAGGSSKMKLMAVRFGNVLGSSGSVIPTFKRQIANGGPVTVTHPEITRYFMITKEAIGLVLQSAALGSGGEIFVLDMGTPIKIIDLAKQMVELSGLRPDIDISIEVTGLRPGEKLFEELSHSSENNVPTDHRKIMRFVGQPTQLESLSGRLLELHACIHSLTEAEIKMGIRNLVPEYEPYLSETKSAQ